ncbi:MAG: hypothetical protein LC747_09115 [Acidobacteria bacterium]|nr:hypothetical protein [Acidobacteriota bacterium]
MNIKHPLQRHKKRKKGDTASLAAQLAPLEEQDERAAQKQQPGANGHGSGKGGLIQDHGSLIVDTENLNIPKSLGGSGTGEEKHFLGIEPVVLVILIGALAFVAFIAWQISLMPPVE